jgi:hypothetical protein
MPFNSLSYHTNKAKRRAKEALAEARQGPPEWSSRTVAEWRKVKVELARSYWASYKSNRFLQRMNADAKDMRIGRMSAADFIAKYEIKKDQP